MRLREIKATFDSLDKPYKKFKIRLVERFEKLMKMLAMNSSKKILIGEMKITR